MIIDVVLGVNIDTLEWINNLKESKADHIAVIDYNSLVEVKEENSIIYMSPGYALEHIKNYDSVNFYKSLYAYPGMGGNMSALYNKK